jgi:hypothetical protein
MVDFDTGRDQQLLYIATGQAETQVPADRKHDCRRMLALPLSYP